MTQTTPGTPMPARLGARIGPEALASILAVAVVIVAVLVFLMARGSPGKPGTAVVPPAATPSPASTQPSSTQSASAPASNPASTASPDTATARVVLQLVDQLLVNRQDLATAVEARRPSAQDIADRLRAVAATLVTLDQPLPELQQAPETADVATRLMTVTDATREAVTETQRASITNAAAYKAGGQKVVDVMEPLVAIRAELVVIVGAAPAP